MLEFVSVLVHVQLAACDLGILQHVRICLGKIFGGGDHESPCVLIQQHLGITSKAAGNMKVRNGSTVVFPIRKLLGNIRYRALAPFAEPGRELRRTFLAEIAVFQLPIAQKTDLIVADVAIFLIEQAHANSPFLLVASQTCCL